MKDTAELAVIDLIGLLVFAAQADPHPSGQSAAYAIAVSQAAATRFGSCDAKLSSAYTLGLAEYAEPEQLSGLYESAIQACPDDPTPAVEKVRLQLTALFRGGAWIDGLDDGDWSAVEADLAALLAELPEIAAVHVVAGDTYAMLARRVATGPFTIRQLQDRSIAAYENAARLSSEPAILLGLAQAHLAAGEPEAAAAALEFFPTTAASPQPIGLATSRAAVAAWRGDFAEALALANEAATTGAASGTTPVLVRDPNAGCASPPYPYVTAPVGATVGVIQISGCGGPGMAEDLGLTPLTRINRTDNDPKAAPILQGLNPAFLEASLLEVRVGYAVLARDWSAAAEMCRQGEVWDRTIALCQVASASGELGAISVAAADAMQDLMRYWSQLDQATAWNQAWTETSPSEPTAWERLGETRFLQGNWAGAAEASTRAAELYSHGTVDMEWSGSMSLRNMSGPGWALLREASAQRQQAHYGNNASQLEAAHSAQDDFDLTHAPPGVDGDPVGDDLLLLSMYAQLERGQVAYAQEDYEDTISSMTASIELRDSFWRPVKTGAQEQAISLANFKLGNYQEALDWANQALDADPFSPLYQETAADARRALSGEPEPGPEISGSPAQDGSGASVPTAPGSERDQDAAGSEEQADVIAAYQAALEMDPTLFSSWNNLGVLLAQDGQTESAADAFKRAIRAVPDYSYAWFNLGALEANQPGFAAFLLSQGALGRAGQLDSSWKGKDPVLAFDDEVYQSGLDVSKPIPNDWHLTQTVRANTPVITAGLVLMLLWRLGRDLAKTIFTERFAQGALGRAGRRGRWAVLTQMRWPAVVTAGVSLAALPWITGVRGWREAAGVGVCAAVLLGWHALAPKLLRAGREVSHRSFPLGSLVTAILAPFGLGFTPPAPVAGGDEGPVAARRAGVVALGVVTVLFAVVAVATAVPTARAASVAGVLVVSSAMIPFHPLDGARIQTRRWAEVAITTLLLAATAAVALAWL
jgi:tetratricopeptide (TPR) repeat protein